MIDGIIKGDGTSRLMQANLPATYEQFRAMAAAGTLPLDVLFNAAGWSQLPDFLNKASLLQDATAALFGLGADAVPDEVLAWVGKYNQHWWRKRSNTWSYLNSPVKTTTISRSLTTSSSVTIMYSTGYTVNEFSVSLDNPVEVDCSYSSPLKASVIRGKFIEAYDEQICYVPMNANVTKRSDGDYYYLEVDAQVVVNNTGDFEYLISSARNTYPDSGIFDGYEYEYLGVPFEKMPIAPRVVTGSYVGTGTDGFYYQNTLNFDFEPDILIVLSGGTPVIMMKGKTSYSFNTGSYVNRGTVTAFGKTISWYSDKDAGEQMNQSGTTYHYLALG